mmetsp:Transcript_29147/g.67577  ORF Transcript_29147/g.67577 Transcript_29147/m.67577 type:complete len:375 (-) Transcript_29147:128-1252(-)
MSKSAILTLCVSAPFLRLPWFATTCVVVCTVRMTPRQIKSHVVPLERESMCTLEKRFGSNGHDPSHLDFSKCMSKIFSDISIPLAQRENPFSLFSHKLDENETSMLTAVHACAGVALQRRSSAFRIDKSVFGFSSLTTLGPMTIQSRLGSNSSSSKHHGGLSSTSSSSSPTTNRAWICLHMTCSVPKAIHKGTEPRILNDGVTFRGIDNDTDEPAMEEESLAEQQVGVFDKKAIKNACRAHSTVSLSSLPNSHTRTSCSSFSSRSFKSPGSTKAALRDSRIMGPCCSKQSPRPSSRRQIFSSIIPPHCYFQQVLSSFMCIRRGHSVIPFMGCCATFSWQNAGEARRARGGKRNSTSWSFLVDPFDSTAPERSCT